MDKVNAALADYLLDRGHPVHLVAHEVEPALREHPLASHRLVARPAGSYLLGEFALSRIGAQCARDVLARYPQARVVVNGSNCLFGDINWVHWVDHAWDGRDQNAPLPVRVKNQIARWRARTGEIQCLRAARLVITNSERTKSDLLRYIPGLDPSRIHNVYLGADLSFAVSSEQQRAAGRQWLNVGPEHRVAAFVGALSHDHRKGLDTLLAAWADLAKTPTFQGRLIIAGDGGGRAGYEQFVHARGLQSSVQFLGHTNRVEDLLSAADLLVSPVRYEAYGLNVHEAICRQVPILVSRTAGFAERVPAHLQHMLLNDPDDASELARSLLAWHQDPQFWKTQIAPFADELRAYSSRDMAEAIWRVAQRYS